ncbi:hypothetical protein [Agrococcus sp. SGAir0287]|uniref:hypothetical protein n=1 Tax=Agrococcus sp. SGAir0287 TaxID=2070347 RepID=UPI0010CCF563|nr:hypothetical protein [Agrococcus sp. SGAir0287]QCR19133.1 hypothetical protein C1N71_06510 [Agrococcus sp. SGAir0287]
MARRESLRTRIRAAGGFYRWWNARLVRLAGPAQLGAWGEDREGRATARGCPECGAAWDAHETLHVLGRAKLVCPVDAA